MKIGMIAMKTDNTEISLSDIAAVLLSSFKLIILVTLFFALLGGAWGFWRGINGERYILAAEENLKKAEESLAVSAQSKEAAEKALVLRKEKELPMAIDFMNSAERLFIEREDYTAKSLYQGIDPFHCGVSRKIVRFDAENIKAGEGAFSPDAAFSWIFSDETELLTSLQQVMKTDAELAYIKELISVTSPAEGIVEITVLHADPDTADKASDIIYSKLVQFFSRNNISRYEIADHYCGFEINWSMYDRQMLNKRNLVAAEEAYIGACEKLHVLQFGVSDLEKAAKEAEAAYKTMQNALDRAQKNSEISKVTTKNIAKRSLRGFMIMLFVGLVISSFSVLFFRFASGKLLNRNMVISACEYPLLGVLPNDKPKLFEKAIRKLEGESGADYQSQAETTAQTLASLVAGKSACFVSSLGKEAAGSLVPIVGDKITVCGDIVNDPEAVKLLSEKDCIILVEKKGLSKISKIDDEIRQAKALGKDILGIVMI